MDIKPITGNAKDPVTQLKEDPQLKKVGAVTAVQPIKKEQSATHSTAQEQTAPSFAHLRQEPLQLLVSAVSTQLQESFGVLLVAHPTLSTLALSYTPEWACARILVLLGLSHEQYREQYKAQHNFSDAAQQTATFLQVANDVLQRAQSETSQVLSNLGLLEGAAVQAIDQTLEQVQINLRKGVHAM